MNLRKLKERRDEINAKLFGWGCPVGLSSIRPWQQGNSEIVEAVSAYHESEPFFTIVTFRYRKPFTGDEGLWSMKFSAGTIIVVCNEKNEFLLKKQHRPTIGKWIWEFPRGFTSILADAEAISKNPIGLVEKILRQEVESVFIGNPTATFTFVDSFPEDTGMSACVIPVYLVRLSGCELRSDVQNKTGIVWSFYPFHEAVKIISDQQSLASLFAIMRKAGVLDQLKLNLADLM
jgi:hypothetical protein